MDRIVKVAVILMLLLGGLGVATNYLYDDQVIYGNLTVNRTIFGDENISIDCVEFGDGSAICKPENTNVNSSDYWDDLDTPSDITHWEISESNISVLNMSADNVDLDGWIDVGTFPEGEEPPAEEGRLFYSGETQSTCYYDEDDNMICAGEDLATNAKNKEGSTIYRGQAVHITGATGQNPEVDLISPNNLGETGIFGLVQKDSIGNNGVGKVILNGRLNNVDTGDWDEGDILYLDPNNAGELVNYKPEYPDKAFKIGTVIRSHTEEGSIFVDIDREFDNLLPTGVLFANDEGEIAEDLNFTFNQSTDTLDVGNIDAGNEEDLNVNSSDYWDGLDTESDLTPSNFITTGDYISWTSDTLNVADNWVDESGDTMSGELDMNGNNITNVDTIDNTDGGQYTSNSTCTIVSSPDGTGNLYVCNG